MKQDEVKQHSCEDFPGLHCFARWLQRVFNQTFNKAKHLKKVFLEKNKGNVLQVEPLN